MHVLKLECIGDNHVAQMRVMDMTLKMAGCDDDTRGLFRAPLTPWVARITGTDPKYGLAREFCRGKKDYSEANSIGSRGVHLHFFLRDGLYEVYELLTWRRTRRYFARVAEGDLTEIDRDEVLACFPATRSA